MLHLRIAQKVWAPFLRGVFGKAVVPRISKEAEVADRKVCGYRSAFLRLNCSLLRPETLACTLYSLRHTHATRLIEAGISPATVSERLGHKDVCFTLEMYVHVTDEMQQNATEEIRKALYE